jgi:hypothetical protein
MQDPRDPRADDEASADQSMSSDAPPPAPDPVEPTTPDPVEPPPPPPVEPVAATTAASEPVATASDPAPPPAPPPSTAAPAATTGRPTGVTIIAILAAIAGVFGIFGGLLLLVSGSFIGVATGSAALGGLAALVGALALGVGVLNLVFAWGAWGLKPWAWTLGIGIEAVVIVLGLFNLIQGDTGSIVSIAIAGLITYYLFQPDVRAAFNRA